VRNITSKTESDTEVKSLKTPSELSASDFNEQAIADNKLKSTVRNMAIGSLSTNLKSNAVETSSRREKAIAAVPDQDKYIDVLTGEQIIRKGEKVTAFHLAKFEAIRILSVSEKKFALSIFGIALVVIVLVIIPLCISNIRARDLFKQQAPVSYCGDGRGHDRDRKSHIPFRGSRISCPGSNRSHIDSIAVRGQAGHNNGLSIKPVGRACGRRTI
jgi:membrane-associated HD superfamily phosphohydrolase